MTSYCKKKKQVKTGNDCRGRFKKKTSTGPICNSLTLPSVRPLLVGALEEFGPPYKILNILLGKALISVLKKSFFFTGYIPEYSFPIRLWGAR